MARRTPPSASHGTAAKPRPSTPSRARQAPADQDAARATPVSKPAAATATAPPTTHRPDVIVDFSLDRGLLSVALRNIGGASAYQVATRFDRAFHGLGGRTNVAALPLFQSMPFLPPGKHLSQLVDTFDAYLQREEPTRLTATITYADRDGRQYRDVVPHDLNTYRSLAEAVIR